MGDCSRFLEIATHTDPGLIRPHNEDSIAIVPSRGLAILADGMGGYNAGEVASGMATALLAAELERRLAQLATRREPAEGRQRAYEFLVEEIARTNSAIYQAAQSQPQYAGMGTTLVMALIDGQAITVAHIGDSRLYRWRRGELDLLTHDHSLLQEQLDCGLLTPEQARFAQHRNLVTRALGVDPQVAPEIHRHDLEIGDIYLLCSDGLNDMVEDGEIAMTLSAMSVNLEQCAGQLIKMANNKGGRDNISVILVRIKATLPGCRSWWQRLRAWFSR